MSLGFANFYQHFIQSFIRIAVLFTSMLKTTRLSKLLDLKAFRADNDKIVGSGGKANKTIKNLAKPKIKKFDKIS